MLSCVTVHGYTSGRDRRAQSAGVRSDWPPFIESRRHPGSLQIELRRPCNRLCSLYCQLTSTRCLYLHCVKCPCSAFAIRQSIFTTLYAMQTQSSDEKAVCPSTCPSNALIVTKRKKDLSRFLYHTKDHLSQFSEKIEWLVGSLLPST